MRLLSKVAILGALLVPLATVPASAQNWKWDINVNGGYSWYSRMIDFGDIDLTPFGLVDVTPFTDLGREVKFNGHVFGGAQIGYWFSPRVGVRANGTYTRTHLDVGDNLTLFRPRLISATNLLNLFDVDRPGFNLWGATGDVLIRLNTPDERFHSFEATPYIALGLGAKWVSPRDNFDCGDNLNVVTTTRFNCSPFLVGFDTLNVLAFDVNDNARLMGLVGLGSDWRVAKHWAIRTEVGDRIWKPEIRRLNPIVRTDGTVFLAQCDFNNNGVVFTNCDNFSKTVNEIYLQAGISYLGGVARPPRVAVAPAPRPSPPPPPPPVSREALSICVIDPTAPGGIRMQTAYLVGGRDTVVVQNGTDMPFSSSVGNVMTASNADWFIRGQPLTITAGKTKLEYVPYGSTRMIEPSDLAYIGTVNGVPVYADRNDVSSFIAELDQINRGGGRELGSIVEEVKTLREELSHVKVLYVPTSPTGCTFQAVQQQEEVRKGGK